MTPPAQPRDEHRPRRTEPDDTEPVPVAPPIAPEPRRHRAIDRWAAPAPDARPYRSSFIGMAGLAMTLFIILASGAVLPWIVIAALTVVWAAALFQGTRWFLSSPVKMMLLPVVVLGIWLTTLILGATLFGWGA
jgi:hypothetical protein